MALYCHGISRAHHNEMNISFLLVSCLFLLVCSSLHIICFCQIYHSVFRKPWRLDSSLSWRVNSQNILLPFLKGQICAWLLYRDRVFSVFEGFCYATYFAILGSRGVGFCLCLGLSRSGFCSICKAHVMCVWFFLAHSLQWGISVLGVIYSFLQKKHITEHLNLPEFLIKALRKVSSYNLA